ncbi:amidohydrolase family protein [Paenibacillus sp. sgz5001063]|uniref:amidohydrolase family protein n=1 Tax=Paenibacillus sp. sgz5001063 TaxID=3242474 RepID=UPI0036D43088
MRIDAHQHYWKIDRGDYGWITPELPQLYRDFIPVDLEPLLKEHGIDGSILVQAAPTLEETQYILSLADQNASVLGVVGWLDLFSSDHRQHYEELRRHPKFKGFRIMIQDMPDASRILEPVFVDALRSYAAEGVPVDLLLTFQQMEPVVNLLRLVPGLRGVIDHLAKPPIYSGQLEPWSTHLAEIASFPGIYCKLSGMVTEAGQDSSAKEDFIPYISRVLELFGPDRVMFGSDWPVCLLAAEYSQVIEIVLNALPAGWGSTEYDRLFGGNAKEFYKL